MAPKGARFRSFYLEHHAFVWRSARRLGLSEAAVDDVVQDVFMAAYRQRDAFEGRSSVKTWLYGITLNAVRMHRRREGRHQRRIDAMKSRGPMPVLRDHAEHQAGLDLLDRLLQRLDRDQRDAFILVALEGISAAEVARSRGESANTIHSRLRLARKRLRRELRRLQATGRRA